MATKVRTKQELEKLAADLIDRLRQEELSIWQAKEVFKIAELMLENEKLK